MTGLVAAAARAGIPDELLRRFATDPSPHVAFQVAKNPDAPADVLAALADHPDTYVRGAVAEHPATPSAILTAWADGSRPEPAAHIVSTAVRNRSLRVEAVVAAAQGGDDLQRAAAANPGCPPDVLRRLAEGPGRSHMLRNPACPADLFEAFAAGDAPAAAANPALTVEAMARLAAHPNTRTRQLLDENPALPVELRLRLAADPDHDTRIAAGQQATHLPDEVVAGLADMSREVI